jgi:hypothetical protein
MTGIGQALGGCGGRCTSSVSERDLDPFRLALRNAVHASAAAPGALPRPAGGARAGIRRPGEGDFLPRSITRRRPTSSGTPFLRRRHGLGTTTFARIDRLRRRKRPCSPIRREGCARHALHRAECVAAGGTPARKSRGQSPTAAGRRRAQALPARPGVARARGGTSETAVGASATPSRGCRHPQFNGSRKTDHGLCQGLRPEPHRVKDPWIPTHHSRGTGGLGSSRSRRDDASFVRPDHSRGRCGGNPPQAYPSTTCICGADRGAPGGPSMRAEVNVAADVVGRRGGQ